MPQLRKLVAATLLVLALPATAASDWIARSNENAQPLLKVLSEFSPEFATSVGLAEYDQAVTDLKPEVNERFRKTATEALAALKAKRQSETDVRVQQDLDILIDTTERQIASSEINQKYLLPYTDIGQAIFQGEFALLQDDMPPKRRAAALVRLKRYVGLESGYTPVTELAKARFTEQLGKPGMLGPVKAQVEQALGNTPRYVEGIRQLYAKYKIKGADKALDALETQLKDYDNWVRTTVIPVSREDFRLPPDLYADNLRNVGLDIPPEVLVKKARLAFSEIRNEMQSIASQIAAQRKLPSSNYRDVIKVLKKEQLPPDKVEATYHEVIGQIEEIIRREKIISLPSRPMIMRMASDAETAAQPAPHMDPPALINNKGERGTFVLTAGNPSTDGKSEGYDDFSHKGATWTLSAHEGRPGHELQFTAMVERGVSLPRSLFAFNSVNVEGWALYAEAETKPYEPLEGQLFALQARLQRAARAILDPMLNLGQITPERGLEVLMVDVGLSRAMAQQEIDRYTFRAPGQATAYFYGYTRLMELRAETEIALGDKFDRLAFNDFLINQGLLPPDLLARAVREEFIPAQQKK
ncbi:DUF885 domain-containing protein [Tahibacter amnicola]|uniref:DUF885 domain-containing protein n=1 Tax=Tahibacter amnicola TaxID=2976241 RepID=A0ABY6BGC1_9GAMM|nr:DUF885 domain-containing protein [Tahibacter amnicola]UXI69078.1 DUF885 domain-containing protein [Tahibacter amnicola]